MITVRIHYSNLDEKISSTRIINIRKVFSLVFVNWVGFNNKIDYSFQFFTIKYFNFALENKRNKFFKCCKFCLKYAAV